MIIGCKPLKTILWTQRTHGTIADYDFSNQVLNTRKISRHEHLSEWVEEMTRDPVFQQLKRTEHSKNECFSSLWGSVSQQLKYVPVTPDHHHSIHAKVGTKVMPPGFFFCGARQTFLPYPLDDTVQPHQDHCQSHAFNTVAVHWQMWSHVLDRESWLYFLLWKAPVQ
jgi:hypothetical protein